MKTLWRALAVVIGCTICSCDKLTQFSPYDANTVHSDLNAKNISAIASPPASDSLVFIALSDSHTKYSDLRAAVNAINSLEGISFAIMLGDITDLGLFKEFDDYYHLISRIKIPYITLIGNHDHLSNGRKIYTKMFGPTNFFFDIGNYRIVAFDNVVWENNNQKPDFEWLDDALEVSEETNIICCFHIHPWDPQLSNGYADEMKTLIENNPAAISLCGHGHKLLEEEMNQRRYLMLPDVTKRQFARIAISGKTVSVKMLNF